MSSRAVTALLAALLLRMPLTASADPAPPPDAAMDPACPKELKDRVLAALWKRRPAKKPGRDAPTVTIVYRNDYGYTADALLFALDGIPVALTCNAPQKTEIVLFAGPLAPGLHHLDAVFDFGFGKGGRGGRSPLTFKVKAGLAQTHLVVIDRNDDEWPVAFLEPSRRENRSK
jgi:hypothetical protein